MQVDQATTLLLDGEVMLGGTPFRLVRLNAAQALLVSGWRAGEPVGTDPAERGLARALVAANLAQPIPSGTADSAVSVVVPVRDRAGALHRLLKHLFDAPQVRRVIVVDDGSGNPAAIAAVTADSGAELIRHNRPRGPAAARNAGAAQANTPLIAFVDSDCVPRSGWLEKLLPHFADPLVALAAPRISPQVPDGGLLARYESARSPHDRGDRPARVVPGGRVPFVPGAALLARAAHLGSGFDPSLRGGEDVDLVWRLTRCGLHVRYEPAANVAHDHHTAAPSWLARRVSYGRHAAPVARRHPGAARPLAISPWSAAAWLATGAGRPMTGAGITAIGAALLARDLRGIVSAPTAVAYKLAGGGTLHSGRTVADALLRTWWPLAAVAATRDHHIRRALAAAALVAPLLDWRSERPPIDPIRWSLLRLVDDAAYGIGVWIGCWRTRTLDPLRPDLGWRMRIMSADDLMHAQSKPHAPCWKGTMPVSLK